MGFEERSRKRSIPFARKRRREEKNLDWLSGFRRLIRPRKYRRLICRATSSRRSRRGELRERHVKVSALCGDSQKRIKGPEMGPLIQLCRYLSYSPNI